MPIRGPGRSSSTVPNHPTRTQKHTAATRHPMASHPLAHDTSAVHTMASPAKRGGTSRASDASSALTTGPGSDSPSPLRLSPDVPGGTSGGGTGSSGSGGSSAPADNGSPEQDDTNLVKWLVAWGIIFALLYVLNRTRWGHAVIYYGLALSLLLLFAINYKAITALLAPASGTQGSDAPSSDTGAQEVPGGDAPGSGLSQRQDIQNGQLTGTTPLRQAAPPVPFSSWVG